VLREGGFTRVDAATVRKVKNVGDGDAVKTAGLPDSASPFPLNAPVKGWRCEPRTRHPLTPVAVRASG
jgi:hypothetical protein